MMRQLVYIALSICFASPLAAQLPISHQYLVNPYSLSPALSGHSSNYETFMGYQRSWIGIQGAPEYRMFSVNGPIGSRMGVGGFVYDDQVGVFRNISLNVSYAYHLQLGDASLLSFGISAGLVDQSIQPQNPSDYADPAAALQQSATKKHFNAGFGLNYQWKNLNVGMALPNILENKTEIANVGTYTIDRQYRFYGMYHWQVSEDIGIDPYVVLNTNFTSTLFELASLVKYKNMVWAGLGYRQSGELSIHLGGLPLSFVAIQYSYGLSGSGIMAQSSGSHEFSLGLLIGQKESTYTSAFNRKLNNRKKGYYKWIDKAGQY